MEVIVLVLLNSINEKLYKSTSSYKEGIFLTKYKFSGAFSERALIKLKMISPIVLKGVVYWFIIIKVCFIGRFSLKLENYFLEEEHVLVMGALQKNCKVFNCFLLITLTALKFYN